MAEQLCCNTSDEVKKLIGNEEIIEKLSSFFKAFSEPLRIEILLAMLHDEICVRDLSALLEVSQPRVSNQLKSLKQSALIKSRKDKNNVFYSLNDEHIHDILSTGLLHISHS